MNKEYRDIVDDCLDDVTERDRNGRPSCKSENSENVADTVELHDAGSFSKGKRRKENSMLYVLFALLFCLSCVFLIGSAKDLPKAMTLSESKAELDSIYGVDSLFVASQEFIEFESGKKNRESLEDLTEILNSALSKESEYDNEDDFQAEYFFFFGDTLLYKEP